MTDRKNEPNRPDDATPPAQGLRAAPPPKPERGPEQPFRADLPRAGGKGKKRSGGGTSRSWLQWLGIAALVLVGVLILTAAGGAYYIQKTYLNNLPALPVKARLAAVDRAPAIKFFDKDGALIAERGPKYGDQVRLNQLPDYVAKAFLAAEDRRFYQHHGVDIRAIARAARANYQAGRVVEGGSTLTQQLAKGLFLTPDQTFRRKVQEAALAVQMEQVLTKNEVLELYLNSIYFGANTFGIDGASLTYFGKPASQLTLPEAALLAALPKAPSRMALHRNMDAALKRQRLVLHRMRGEGWITEPQLAEAIATPPQLASNAIGNDGDNGYLLDYATSEVLRLAGPNSPDLMVRLTIDPKLQATGAEVLRRVIQDQGRAGGATQGAMIAVDSTGAIRTMVGGIDYSQSVFNRAVQARRQPGSSFKPLVYAAALEKGVMPFDVRVDEPVKIGDWAPRNYGGGYRGPVTVATALALSINTVAVKLGQEVGPAAIGDISRRFGITTIPENPNLAVALGAYEVPLIQMVSAYQVFQQAGNRITPHMVDQITTVDGAVVYTHQTASPLPAYDIHWASMMVNMLKKVIASGTGTGAEFGRPAAGKTGTSQNWRDAWFIGFTPDIVAGVWVGNDDDKPMDRVTGGEVAAQIWRRYMIVAHEGLPVRDFDWLLPDPVQENGPEEDDPRNPFYAGLAAEFAATAAQADAPEAAAPMEPATEPTPEPAEIPN